MKLHTLKEIGEALSNKKKIRNLKWKPSNYIYYDYITGTIKDHMGFGPHVLTLIGLFEDIADGQWVICQEKLVWEARKDIGIHQSGRFKIHQYSNGYIALYDTNSFTYLNDNFLGYYTTLEEAMDACETYRERSI